MVTSSLKQLTDQDLVKGLKLVVARLCSVENDLLHYLAEVEDRKLYLSKGYSSLFGFLTSELNFSESSACRRIAVARIAKRFPALYQMIKDNKIHLTAVSMLAPHLTEKNYRELLTKASGLSKRQIEQLIADIAPKPEQKDLIRTLPILNLKLTERAHDLQAPDNQDVQNYTTTGKIKGKDQLTPLSAERVMIKFHANKELLTKIEQAKNLLAHSYPEGKLEDIFSHALDLLIKHKTPKDQVKPPQSKRDKNILTRYIPKSVKAQVYKRDQGHCSYLSKDGKRCGSKYMLEYDHIQPFALNGRSDDPQNIRLLCRQHNQYRINV